MKRTVTTKLGMNDEVFWKLIVKSRQENKKGKGEQGELLIKYLLSYSPQDIVKFDNILQRKVNESANAGIRIVSFIVCGYTSDSAFEDFRAWLVGQGKERYYKVLEDPELICEFLEKEDWINVTFTGDGILGGAAAAFVEKTGKDYEDFVDLLEDPFAEFEMYWPEKSEAYQSYYPKLYAKFWSQKNQERIDNYYKDNPQ